MDRIFRRPRRIYIERCKYLYIWEESHQLSMSDDKETETFADGFHEGEWERDVEVPRPQAGLNQILRHGYGRWWKSKDYDMG